MLSQWLKTHGNQALIGLDIGSDDIKVVEIDSRTKPYKLEKFILVPLPTGTIVKGQIKDIELVGKVLRDSLRNAGIETKFAAVAIPRSSTVTKTIKVDSRLTHRELESRAWIEANHHFPDLVGEIYLDFTVEPSENPNENELMLVACRRDHIQPYLDVLKETGLTPKVVDVSSYALCRSLNLITTENSDLNTIGLLNMDFNITTLLVSHHKKLVYAHDHNFDGSRLISLTDNYLKNSEQQTASIDDAEYNEILKSTLTAHIRHLIHFFYSSLSSITIQKMILSGDCAATPNLAKFIHQETGIETVVADPVKQLEIASVLNVNEVQKIEPAFMLAIGLALSEQK